jgi:hypothetical protein
MEPSILSASTKSTESTKPALPSVILQERWKDIEEHGSERITAHIPFIKEASVIYKHPNNQNVTVCNLLVDMERLHSIMLRNDPNYRLQDIYQERYKELRQSVVNNPYFDLYNKGTTIHIHSLRRMNVLNNVVTIHQEEGDGAFDGLHGWLAALDFFGSAKGKRYIRICIIASDDNLDGIARAHSQNIKAVSCLDAEGYFDFLKDALPAEMRRRIIWKENDDGTVTSTQLVKDFTCFNVELFPTKKTTPTAAYSNSCFSLVQNNRESYKKFSHIVLPLLKIISKVRFDSVGFLKTQSLSQSSTEMLSEKLVTNLFTGEYVQSLNNTITPMILSAYRPILEDNGLEFEFRVSEPETYAFIDETLPHLLLEVLSRKRVEIDTRAYARGTAYKASGGKDYGTKNWRKLYAAVEMLWKQKYANLPKRRRNKSFLTQ